MKTNGYLYWLSIFRYPNQRQTIGIWRNSKMFEHRVCKGILKNLLIHKPCPAQFSRDILRNCSEVVYTFRSYLPCLLTITRKETLKSFKLGRRKHLENKAHSCQFSPLFTHCPHLSPISTLFHFFLQFKDSKNYSY